MEPRPLTRDDLPDLLSLSLSANWNHLEADWRRLLDLAPGSCWGIEGDGHIVASATAISYGRALAWIGMVLTLPEWRGRGFASTLLRHLMDRLDVATLKLDATGAGHPVYEKLGFVDEAVVERWVGTLAPAPARTFPLDLALDREAFGADRAALLKCLGLGRPGRVAGFVGPIVARTVDEARERVLACGAAGRVFWDVPLANPQAVELARGLGFQSTRRLWRMRKGAPITERPEYVYALAGFELG
jgi:GNAT superfamily N-acetyltransferase